MYLCIQAASSVLMSGRCSSKRLWSRSHDENTSINSPTDHIELFVLQLAIQAFLREIFLLYSHKHLCLAG